MIAKKQVSCMQMVYSIDSVLVCVTEDLVSQALVSLSTALSAKSLHDIKGGMASIQKLDQHGFVHQNISTHRYTIFRTQNATFPS